LFSTNLWIRSLYLVSFFISRRISPRPGDDLQPDSRARLQVFSCDHSHRLLQLQARVKGKVKVSGAGCRVSGATYQGAGCWGLGVGEGRAHGPQTAGPFQLPYFWNPLQKYPVIPIPPCGRGISPCFFVVRSCVRQSEIPRFVESHVIPAQAGIHFLPRPTQVAAN
jgi:hypothetical protein